MLGFNSSGGSSAGVVAHALATSGTLVTYGSMERKPAITAGLDLFTNKDLTLKGINIDRILSSMDRTTRDAQVVEAVGAVSKETVRLLVARESFKEFNVALTRATKDGERKVVLTF